MKRANCKHLTYKHAAYLGCTVEELCVIAGIYIVLDLLMAGILSIFLGRFFIIFVILFIISYMLVKFTARRIGILKGGRQQGYVILKLKQALNQKLFFLSLAAPFITRVGKWSTRRSMLWR